MGEVSRRQRAPWKPERGQYVSVFGIAVPEWTAFTITVFVALLVVILIAF